MTSSSMIFTAMECEYSLISTLYVLSIDLLVFQLSLLSLLLPFSDVANGARDHISSHLMVMLLLAEENLDRVKQYPSLHHCPVDLLQQLLNQQKFQLLL